MEGSVPVDSVTIHSKGLVIDEGSIAVYVGTGPNIPILDIAYDFKREYFSVHFDGPVTGAGTPLTVSLSYTGDILTEEATLSAGFYVDSYMDFATQERRELAVTQFETIVTDPGTGARQDVYRRIVVYHRDDSGRLVSWVLDLNPNDAIVPSKNCIRCLLMISFNIFSKKLEGFLNEAFVRAGKTRPKNTKTNSQPKKG